MKHFLLESFGFTLIELIVVISVISILSTIGIVSFVNYDRAQQLSGSVSNIVNLLNEAKSNSLSQVKPQICEQSALVLDGYEVQINTSSRTLSISSRCSSGDGTNQRVDFVKSITLPINIGIKSPIGANSSTVLPNDIFFYRIFSKDVDGGIITIQSYGVDVRTIEVTNLGTITVKNLP